MNREIEISKEEPIDGHYNDASSKLLADSTPSNNDTGSIRQMSPAALEKAQENVRKQPDNLIRATEESLGAASVPPGAASAFRIKLGTDTISSWVASGIRPQSDSFDFGFFGAFNYSERPDPNLFAKVIDNANLGAKFQSGLISKQASDFLPLTSKYLNRGITNDIGRILGLEPASDKPSLVAASANADTKEPTKSVESPTEDLSQVMKIDPNGKPDLTYRAENRFSAYPERFNVLDVRRNLPENWNIDGAADYLLNSLSDKVERDNSAGQYLSGDGNLVATTDIKSRSGDMSTTVTHSNPAEVSGVKALFFSLQTVEPKDFPQAVVDVANLFRFNADCMHALQLAQKESDPILNRAAQLAIVQKQLEQYGVKYYDIAYDQAQKLSSETKEETSAKNREKFAALYRDLRERNLNPHLPEPHPPLGVPENQSKGLSDAEKAAAGKLLKSLITREDLLRAVGRAKFNTW
jgi:hypothetical protein